MDPRERPDVENVEVARILSEIADVLRLTSANPTRRLEAKDVLDTIPCEELRRRFLRRGDLAPRRRTATR